MLESNLEIVAFPFNVDSTKPANKFETAIYVSLLDMYYFDLFSFSFGEG